VYRAKVNRLRIASVIGILVVCSSCRPPAAVIAGCQPIPAVKLRGVNTVLIIANIAPYEPRKTDDPHLVLRLLTALEHGMVDDPQSEARIRWDKPYNGMLTLESRRPGKPGHMLPTIYFDATDLNPPRYRKEFVDAVTAAYKGAESVGKFQLDHPDPLDSKGPKPPFHS